MKVFVYHTPEETPSEALPECAVVIDVLRATTTIARVLAGGADSVQTFSNIEALMAASESWPGDRRLRAGERGGAKVEGCDCGNSPLEYEPDIVKDKRLFLTTTNGTRALERVRKAPTVLTAALVNRAAVVRALDKLATDTVWLVGSGWQGSYSLEDTVCAGAMLRSLVDSTQTPIGEIAGNDEAIAATTLFDSWRDRLENLMELASHGRRLLGLDCRRDLEYCARTDILEVVPTQIEPGILGRG